MPTSPALAQVVPTTASFPLSHEHESDWQFELQPAHELPVVDLSVSLRSRFVKGAWLAQFTKRYGRLSVIAFMVGIIMIVAAFVVQNDLWIQPLALVASMLVLPAPLLGISVLRYAMVRLLVKSYDFWFFFACNSGYFIAVSLVLGDVRIFAVFTFWCGTNLNILVDASLRGARSMVAVNVVVLVASIVFLVSIKLEWIQSMRSPVLIQYGVYALPAQGFAVTTLLTLLAMVVRNIYRLMQAMRRRSVRLRECVSYRCSLRLAPCLSCGPRDGSVVRTLTQPRAEISPVQQLQCVLTISLVDARKTIVSRLLTIVARAPLGLRLVRVSGIGAFATSLAAASTVDYSRGVHRSSPTILHLVAVALTATFIIASAAMYLRQVYKALLSSFDFLYVSKLLTVIHLTACDFFQWHSSPCLVLATSWLWIHWALCVDSLSPLVKDAFRVHVRFPAVVITTAIAASGLLLYRRIVLDTSDEPYDRVLWSGVVLGRKVAFHALTYFYDSMGSFLIWAARLLYRAWRFDADMMIVLDGPVAYTNYLTRPRGQTRQGLDQVSRQWEETPRSRKLSTKRIRRMSPLQERSQAT